MNSQRKFETGQEGELIPQERERVSVDDLNLKVQQAEEVLLDLERRREQIERQKRQLEEIRRKQYEFEEGQRLTIEKLRRSLVLLNQQEFELKRELEETGLVRDTFDHHLLQLEAIRPQAWEPLNLEDELTKALATIDQAKATYAQSQIRLEAVRRQGAVMAAEPDASGDGEGAVAPSDFGARVLAGLAYSLPLIVFLLLVAVIWLFAK